MAMGTTSTVLRMGETRRRCAQSSARATRSRDRLHRRL